MSARPHRSVLRSFTASVLAPVVLVTGVDELMARARHQARTGEGGISWDTPIFIRGIEGWRG